METHAPLVDCHTHTLFSDGVATFEENVRAAAGMGCRALVSTDHLTLPASIDPHCEASVYEGDLAAHRDAFDAAKALAAEIAPELELIFGFECDWYAGCEPLIERWSAGAVVRLGSVHWIGDPGDIHAGAGKPFDEGGSSASAATAAASAEIGGSGFGSIDDPANLQLWHELGPDEVWRRYVRTWCLACESPLAFDAMAHPDLAARFVNEGLAPTIDLAPLWNEMAACARDTGCRVEVSTAGLRKGVGDYYPSTGLLACFQRAGVHITFSSDAHRAQDVCWGIRDAQRHAFKLGYRHFDMPHADGSWETVELA